MLPPCKCRTLKAVISAPLLIHSLCFFFFSQHIKLVCNCRHPHVCHCQPWPIEGSWSRQVLGETPRKSKMGWQCGAGSAGGRVSKGNRPLMVFAVLEMGTSDPKVAFKQGKIMERDQQTQAVLSSALFWLGPPPCVHSCIMTFRALDTCPRGPLLPLKMNTLSLHLYKVNIILSINKSFNLKGFFFFPEFQGN